MKNVGLSGANLEGAYLTGANLKDAKVSVSELSVAFLEGATMCRMAQNIILSKDVPAERLYNVCT